MRITFVRARGQRDRVYVVRSDGSEVSWAFPSYGDLVPHDLVHWAAESAFGLRRGFWGAVDAGADPGRINEVANRRGGRSTDKYAPFGPDLDELWLAERLAGALSSGEGADDLDPAALALARDAVRRLGERWRALGEKGALTVRFDPADPRRSLASIDRSTDDLETT